MKKALCLLCVAALLSSCAEKEWEYKTVSIDSEPHNAYETSKLYDPESMLNEWGKNGWELVSSYTEIRTSFPNFGDNQYVTGIRTNTATERVTFVLKREVGSRGSTSGENSSYQ